MILYVLQVIFYFNLQTKHLEQVIWLFLVWQLFEKPE